MTVEQLARQMYETQENRVVPSWDSLSGGTLDLWLERARDRLFGDIA